MEKITSLRHGKYSPMEGRGRARLSLIFKKKKEEKKKLK